MWWPQTNRVPWQTNDTPGTLVNPWTSTKGTKGTTVVVVVVRTLVVFSVSLVGATVIITLLVRPKTTKVLPV